MCFSFYGYEGDTPFWTSKFGSQKLSVWERDHSVYCTMYDLDPFAANLIPELLDLLRGLVMPPGRNRLQEEAFSSIALHIFALHQLLSRVPVSVGWKVAFGVGLIKKRLTKESLFVFSQLSVDVSWYAVGGSLA